MADTLHEKLIDIQQRLKVPKDINNDFGGFKYRNLEDIEEKVKPLLKEHGLVLIFNDEIIAVADRVYVKATAYLSDGKESLTASAVAREATTPKAKMDDSQLTGSCSSYARKYAAGGLFLIDDTNDADSRDNSATKTRAVKVQPSNKTTFDRPFNGRATEKQRQLVEEMLAREGIAVEEMPGYLIEQFGVEVPLTKEGASFAIDQLKGTARQTVNV